MELGAIILATLALGIFMHREFCGLRERIARLEGLFEGYISNKGDS